MDDQKGLFLNWTYFYQDKTMDQIRQSLMHNMELDEIRLKAQEEIKLRDHQISQLKLLLTTTIKERNQAQENRQEALFEKLLFQQLLQHYQNSAQHSAISSIEDEPKRGIDSNSAFTSSDCDESIVSSPHPTLTPPYHHHHHHQDHLPMALDKPLPEKGKLLEAVMKAGPLLQTLLLAGPLPQWRHPPPPLDTYQIPPPPVEIPTMPLNQDCMKINNCGKTNMKRTLPEDSDSRIEFKQQRTVLQ